MSGYANIKISNDSVYVRFEGVHPRYLFNALMDRFHLSFPLKTWNGERRAWQMPSSDTENLIAFCRTIFGAKGCIVVKDSTTRYSPRQLSLDFDVRVNESLDNKRFTKN
jgi:hypothetical protein